MTPVVVFLAAIAAILAWWLSQQRLMARPWLEIGLLRGNEASSLPASKIGLRVFLAVVGCLFALFISAYFMRMDMADWRPLPTPKLLWFNTCVLVLSSVALQGARGAAQHANMNGVRAGLLAGGVLAVAFLIGQLLAWQQLSAEGYFPATNPANAFFYLITGMHGLHILGGLFALAGTTHKAWRGSAVRQVRLSVELCATYWHSLLFVWLVLFALLTHWADGFVLMCRSVLS